jgi:DNA-binding beta-propeller fold protein YncE
MSQQNRVTLAGATAILGMIALCASPAQAESNSPLPLPNPFHVDETFKLELPPGLKSLGSLSGVKVGPDGNLYVVHRCVLNACTGHDDVPPIIVATQQGKLIRSLGAGMFVWPHGVAIAKDGTMWISDAVGTNGVDKDNPNKGHQVFHLDKNGKILLALGKPGVAGAGHDTFNAPSDVIVAKNGDIFVADGHGPGMNARIVKFDKHGKYITEWGTRGSGPGQFELPHAMAFDSQGRLFVADRNNNRIEIFDQDGKFLMEWKQFGRPSGLAIDMNDTLYVSDTQPTKDRPGFENGIYIGSAKDGKVTGFIPKIRPHSGWEGLGPGGTNMEAIGVAPDGNSLYGGDSGLLMVVKFVRNK